MERDAPNPASLLLGRNLSGGWKVVRHLSRPPGATGGYFSEGYIVEHKDGREAFLKALDYSAALAAPDPAQAINELTSGFLHERALLQQCTEDNLSHVVLAVGFGDVEVPGYGALSRVQYLILERAEHDVRHHMLIAESFDLAWVLRTIHHISVGLRQLHMRSIFHQDLKPSNVLQFASGVRKIGDLGRATRRGHAAVHDELMVAGDLTYAAPELLYAYLLPDDTHRRMAGDMYHLGSMAFFFFMGIGLTSAIHARLDPTHYAAHWTGQYEEVLPHVRDVYDRVIEDLRGGLPSDLVERLVPLIHELTDPDPRVRGDQRRRASGRNPFELERYVSRFNLLAREAELNLKRVVLR